MAKRTSIVWQPHNQTTVVKLYKGGKTTDEIAELFGVSAKPITAVLKHNSIVKRSKSYYATGERNQFWNGGRSIDKHGYILVHSPNHPYRTNNNQVREHRLVVEAALGRYLEPTEVVDHINGIKSDNRIENLRVFANNGVHLATTRKGKRPNWKHNPKEWVRLGIRTYKRICAP
jgi:intein-encoded DNA endonuclease-like protein